MNKKQMRGIGQRIGHLVAWSVFSAVIASACLMTFVQADRQIESVRTNFENTGYVLASSVLSIAALFAGLLLARRIFA